MRSTALCIVRTTCTDTTEPCRRWPSLHCMYGWLGPRTGPRPPQRAPDVNYGASPHTARDPPSFCTGTVRSIRSIGGAQNGIFCRIGFTIFWRMRGQVRQPGTSAPGHDMEDSGLRDRSQTLSGPDAGPNCGGARAGAYAPGPGRSLACQVPRLMSRHRLMETPCALAPTED